MGLRRGVQQFPGRSGPGRFASAAGERDSILYLADVRWSRHDRPRPLVRRCTEGAQAVEPFPIRSVRPDRIRKALTRTRDLSRIAYEAGSTPLMFTRRG